MWSTPNPYSPIPASHHHLDLSCLNSRSTSNLIVFTRSSSTKSGRPGEVSKVSNNAIRTDWRERLFDIMFSNAGNLFMLTVVASLFFKITREQGEHKEYKRLTAARLDDAQHALRACQAQVHQAADASRQELANALARTNTAVPPEEVKRLVDQLLTGLVAHIDASLTTEESKATTQTEASSSSSDSAPADTNTPVATSSTAAATTAEGHQAGYHKVV